MTTADIVNTWFRECIACGAIARDTPAYNQAVAALPDLLVRLDPAAVEDAPAEALVTVEPPVTPPAGEPEA